MKKPPQEAAAASVAAPLRFPTVYENSETGLRFGYKRIQGDREPPEVHIPDARDLAQQPRYFEFRCGSRRPQKAKKGLCSAPKFAASSPTHLLPGRVRDRYVHGVAPDNAPIGHRHLQIKRHRG